MGREQTPTDLCPRPPSSVRTLQSAGRRCSAPGSRRLVGRGPGAPTSPPPAAPAWGRGGRYFLFRGVSPAGGVGGHGKVRPQVCGGGRRHARRGAAIFGDFGAAEPRPPLGKPRPGQPRPRPPPALSHRPGGGGSNGLGALGALLALFSQGGSRLAGGTKGRWRAAGAGAEGVAAVPHLHPRFPRPRSSAAGPAATVGVGLRVPPPPVRWPQGVGGMRGQMPGWGGGEWPPFWKHRRKPGIRGRGGAQLQVEPGPLAPRRGRGSTAFCAVIFLFCNWAVLGLAQGHFGAAPTPPASVGRGPRGRGSPWLGRAGKLWAGGRESAFAALPRSVLSILRTETWASEK